MSPQATAQRDKIDRELLRTDQAINKQDDIIAAATSRRQDLEAVRRSLLAAAVALRAEGEQQ